MLIAVQMKQFKNSKVQIVKNGKRKNIRKYSQGRKKKRRNGKKETKNKIDSAINMYLKNVKSYLRHWKVLLHI